MKSSKRQLTALAALLAILILSAAVLSSCYIVKSGKMNKIEGTYQLTTYSGKSDYLAERELVLYVVIRANGTGHLAWKDNSGEPHFEDITCSFEADPEKSGYYSYVLIDFKNGKGPTRFGIQAAGLFEIDTKLGSSTLAWNNTSDLSQGTHTVNVTLTRVSKATDLSYVNEHINK